MTKFYVVKTFPNLMNMEVIRKTEWVPMDGKLWAQFICEDGFIRTFNDQEVEPAPLRFSSGSKSASPRLTEMFA